MDYQFIRIWVLHMDFTEWDQRRLFSETLRVIKYRAKTNQILSRHKHPIAKTFSQPRSACYIEVSTYDKKDKLSLKPFCISQSNLANI